MTVFFCLPVCSITGGHLMFRRTLYVEYDVTFMVDITVSYRHNASHCMILVLVVYLDALLSLDIFLSKCCFRLYVLRNRCVAFDCMMLNSSCVCYRLIRCPTSARRCVGYILFCLHVFLTQDIMLPFLYAAVPAVPRPSPLCDSSHFFALCRTCSRLSWPRSHSSDVCVERLDGDARADRLFGV